MNESPENFTWAQNGAGVHTQEAAAKVAARLWAADAAGGKQGVLDELNAIKTELGAASRNTDWRAVVK